MMTVGIIQARMGSTRLPGKMMLPLAGKPMLFHVIERTKRIQGVDEIILATTTKRRDDVLVRLAKKNGIRVFRGPEEDVLKRFIGAAEKYTGEIILRINADCPLFDPQGAEVLLRERQKRGADAVFFDKAAGVLQGFEVIALKTLKRINIVTHKNKDAFAREHVSVYVSKNPRYYPKSRKFAKVLFIKPSRRFRIKNISLAVDTRADYFRIKRIYESLARKSAVS